MRRYSLPILVALSITILPLLSQAQLGSRIARQAVGGAASSLKRDNPEPVEDTYEYEDSEYDEAPQESNSQPNFMERRMMAAMGLRDVPHEKYYSFKSSIAMEIEAVDADGSSERVLYTTFFSDESECFAISFDAANQETGEKQKSQIIFDSKNNAMLILSEQDGERSGIAMHIPPDSTTQAEEIEVEADLTDHGFVHPLYQPTGRTKNISGFNCSEYNFKSDESSISLWISHDKNLNLSRAYGQMSGFQVLAAHGWGYGQGILLEMEFHDTETNTRSHMVVKEININSPKDIDISGYTIIGMGGSN